MTRTPRDVCYVCFKPRTTCVCARVPRVDNRTPVLVVQHPRERLHPIGTLRFVSLALSRQRTVVAWDAGAREEETPDFVPEGAGLLYPSKDAALLDEVPPSLRPTSLVVIDGTWHTARTLHRDKAWLARLPHYRLSPAAPSRYRIRREPSRDSVSTLEAVVEALRVLEPETAGLDELLHAFDGMIDEQLAFMSRHEGALRTKERRPPGWRGTPRALVEDFSRLVVAYVESAREDPRGARELVQCSAVALGTGRTFDVVLRPSFGRPSDAHLHHMGLPADAFDGAPDGSAFPGLWHEFLGDLGAPPVVAAWNQSSLDLLASALGGSASRAALKNAYRTVRGSGSGSLDDAVRAEGLVAEPGPFHGRASLRVARAVAMARHLNALALGAAGRPAALGPHATSASA